ncbi:MAG: hypothetical protein KAR38_15105, partial [Calditrichia bacterium]|nr:hypothetical protein [Calditrichia bacterium]
KSSDYLLSGKQIMKGDIMSQCKEFIAKGRSVFVGLEDSKVNWKLCVRCDDYIIHKLLCLLNIRCSGVICYGSKFKIIKLFNA